MRRLVAAALALCGLWSCQCGNAPPSAPPPSDAGVPNAEQLASLQLEPGEVVLTVEGEVPAEQDYRAVGTYQNGETLDVTAWTTFRASGLGTFVGSRFVSQVQRGGTAVVSADVGGLHASAGVTLVLKKQVKDPRSQANLPGDVATRFGGADAPARAPVLVYPNDGVLLPPNLGKLELHFLPGTGNTLFELAFNNALTDLKVYLRCTQPMNGGCIYLPDPEVWRYLAETNRGGAAVQVTLKGTDDAGTAVGTSSPLMLSFSQDDIEGGLYYWTTSGGTGIMRFDFGATQQEQAEKFIGTERTNGVCVGCHALSHDGRKVVAEAGGQNDGRLLLLDVGSQQPLVPFGSTDKSIFESWDPEGNQFVGVYGDAGASDYRLLLFDGNTGAQVGAIPSTGDATHPADHPDWAADGSRIAYTRVGIKNTMQRMYKGSIWMVAREGASWGTPVQVVPAQSGKNRYYPAFSPTGDLLVFDESTCPTGEQHRDCNADSDPTARLFMVRAEPGQTPVELARANAPGLRDGATTALSNSFPKWSPFVFQRTGELGSRLLWLTFSSTRRYGLRDPLPGGEESDQGTLLWMTAIDPDRMAQGQDPSYPAFVLPFQDLTTSNHIAQWATRVVPVIN